MENQTKKGQVWLHDPVVLNHIITEFDLQDYGNNAAEGILFETSETRVTSIFDYVMKLLKVPTNPSTTTMLTLPRTSLEDPFSLSALLTLLDTPESRPTTSAAVK
mmetsp:Transcript_18775/g.33982  ORF Transcript_18775/g.33982 Transcript_18775/m.33982 type:complete len:105 (+) Transcript_18775:483-797(+)